MFCPECRCEFRPGFTRCAACDVDLVDDLASVDTRPPASSGDAPPPSSSFVNFCGFFSLDEAKEARETLRGEGIHTEILIREHPGESGAPEDEFWIRVPSEDVARTSAVLGFDEAGETD